MMTIGGTLKKISIEINAEELVAFRQFQRILPDVTVMLEAGVFDFKAGSVIIHRDANGSLQLIVPNWPVYRAPHR